MHRWLADMGRLAREPVLLIENGDDPLVQVGNWRGSARALYRRLSLYMVLGRGDATWIDRWPYPRWQERLREVGTPAQEK